MVQPPFFISVIITTYNQPAWLERVLVGYNHQNFKDFEVVIADDGSSDETIKLIERYKKIVSYPIQHIWHTDEGFRKCTILNKAIIASKGNYLLLTDGDCIPRADFLEVHAKYAEKGYFLSGGMYRTTLDVAHKIQLEDISTQRCFDIDYMRSLGQPRRFFKDLKLSLKYPKLKNFLNSITPANASWNGHNSSGWKEDIVKINGFNEKMKYGGLDRELGERLFNLGIKSKQIRYSAICVHLEHKRGYVTAENWKNNYAIRKKTRREKLQWIEEGISTHL
ncbi:glycosyl transferase family 2 [Bacteroides coprosuis DSM 18011]|uniref:Glycosyl transferase family 2 n=1 Tax=Bacteroides coprosuis DSM 18011 TaxID=679937 RepID=F3ZPD1_9BACE|nr:MULTISPECIES: glycosyltransferase family 2 protein [Bacteroides]EGJ71588.1 glycosyl transferase family 2 [Bacteroides coprosuis DSM 18011]HJD92860.1 glycosyltransferase family 2 protein [Bacteroides coprosuis]